MKRKAFSLVELLVAMAIIAVLLGLAGFGISVAQRNSRDSQRQAKVNDIRIGITDYQTRNSSLPALSATYSATTLSFVAGATGARVGNVVTVATPGVTAALGSATTATNSTQAGTVYCYTLTLGNAAGSATSYDGYVLGARQENGNVWHLVRQGTSTNFSCGTNNAYIVQAS